ncbi:helix-turn-helix domain-containing protein [Kribbella sp. NPDC051620]|uniref:helix-turn-helix domain-containing protein n=1 Tax=Kribbella sp. NPDC051620 TaxID=3364120 RepID=UPI00379B9224
MSAEEHLHLAVIIKNARREKGYSASELARRAGLQPSTVTRLEAAQLQHPLPETLVAIGRVLNLPASDLYVCLDWMPKEQLPRFAPYLRAKYGDIPAEDVAKLEGQFLQVAQRDGYECEAPKSGKEELI